MLRSANDSVTVASVLSALASILPLNTRLATTGGTVLVNAYDALLQHTKPFPALVITTRAMSTARIEYRLWQKKLTVHATYFDVWQQTTQTLDTLWGLLDTDLQRMVANLEDNPTLTLASVRHADSIAQYDLDGYEAELSNKQFKDTVVERHLTILINLPAYASLT